MKKNTLIMLGVFVVLLLVALVAENPFGGKKRSEPPLLFPGFDSTSVAFIEVTTPSDTTRLAKSGDLWRVTTHGDYPADPKAVGDLIARVQGLRREEIASRQAGKHSLFQVDGQIVQTRFLGPDETPMAHLFVGKSGPGYSGSYVRVSDSDDVILVSGYIRGTFDKGPRGWRDRAIFDVDQNTILRFRMERADTLVTVGTEDKIRWYVGEPDSVEARMSSVDMILRTFSKLMADDFDPDVSLEDAGLDEPWGTFTAHTEDGTDLVLLVGADDSGSRWVKRSDRGMIFKVRTYHIQNLFQNVEQIREMTPEEKEAAGQMQ